MPATPPGDRFCRICGVVVDLSNEFRHDLHRAAIAIVPQVWALTILDPWMWAIDALPVGESKDIENRKWPPYGWIRRQRWIAAHVGQTFDGDEARHRIAQIGGAMPPSEHAAEMQARRGKITAFIRIDGAHAPGDLFANATPPKWWFREQHGWQIGARVKLARPVAAVGKHKVWRVPVPVAVQLADQLPPEVLAALAAPPA